MVSSKESSSQLFYRYVWLVDFICRHGRVSFEQIDEGWASSPLNCGGGALPLRTFHAHRGAIEDFFDIKIECDRKDGYRYFIALSQVGRTTYSALINAFITREIIGVEHGMANYILPQNELEGIRFLTTFFDAIRKGLVLQMSYIDNAGEAAVTVEVRPYCLKQHRGEWYILSPDIEGMELYELSRVVDVAFSGVRYSIPSVFSAAHYFDSCFGVEKGSDTVLVGEVEDVKLRLYGSALERVRFSPLHRSQQEVESSFDSAVFALKISISGDFVAQLLSFGGNVEVLSPKFLRKQLAQELKRGLKRYKK